MKRTFIQTKEFSRRWDELGFTDHDLLRLEEELLKNPGLGKVMEQTGGLRKMRFAFEHRGRSGSTRVCYVDFVAYETIYLITIFPKNEKENLFEKEKSDIKKVITFLEEELNKRR
jgi:hypothetical protein